MHAINLWEIVSKYVYTTQLIHSTMEIKLIGKIYLCLHILYFATILIVLPKEAAGVPVIIIRNNTCDTDVTDYFRCPLTDGIFAHPQNCYQFYQCTNDCAQERICPGRLHFSVKDMACLYSFNVSCLEPPPILNWDIFEGRDDNYSCVHDGAFPHDSECAKYYLCKNSVAHLYTCRNKLFDKGFNACNHPELTHCADRHRPADLPGTVTPPPTTPPPYTPPPFRCPSDEHRYYSDPYNCTLYYICHKGVVLGHEQCSDNLLFDEEEHACTRMTACKERKDLPVLSISNKLADHDEIN